MGKMLGELRCAACGALWSAEPHEDQNEMIDPCPSCGRERGEDNMEDWEEDYDYN